MIYETIVGATGAAFVLTAFVLSSLEKIHRFSYKYMALNGIGSSILLYYAWLINGIIFAVTNSVWLSIELYYLSRKLRGR